jgi:hypothetical protein
MSVEKIFVKKNGGRKNVGEVKRCRSELRNVEKWWES